jgi:hypothetical protein
MRLRNKRKNIEEANKRLEESYLQSKISTHYDKHIDIMLTESAEEIGINIKNLLKENKQLLKEGLALTIIGSALASGKLLDLIGVFFKKAWNFMMTTTSKMTTCKNTKGQQQADCLKTALEKKIINKTKFEEWGEWIHKNVIMTVFKGIATVLVGIFAPAFLIKDDELNNELIEKIGNTLFYAAIIIVGGLGIKEVLSHGLLASLKTFTGITESITVSTKFYEVILLIIASVLIITKKIKESNVPKVAHILGECLESTDIKGVIVKLKSMLKKETRELILNCVNENVGGHH